MYALEVKGLTKKYSTFTLENVEFSVDKGKITGLIGRNGAGKSTTLKGILNLIKTNGSVRYFDEDFFCNEGTIKQRIGYVNGGFEYYRLKPLFAITKTVSSFYTNWNDELYRKYMNLFKLDERKKVSELSEGMKVKYSITLALSHNAEILIMDEPTSGLDPLSREEFCDIILDLNKNQGITVLFSTHITSDLMRIADDVIYISGGKVIMQEQLERVLNKYHVINFATEDEAKNYNGLIGLKRVKSGFAALTELQSDKTKKASLDDIMIHFEVERGGTYA
ncbi:MAG: ABC transporter ATP-binding protein [Clostridiales bacterium]|nr:ABC transporter ATP-binding protein [Clostridiales bacterium]